MKPITEQESSQKAVNPERSKVEPSITKVSLSISAIFEFAGQTLTFSTISSTVTHHTDRGIVESLA
jgi:hypothetical protein